MAGLVPPPLLVPESEETRFITQGDLTSTGRLGTAALVVTDQNVRRFEKTPIGEETLATYEMGGLANPRIETLVDACALVADYNGHPVELLRASAKRGLQLAGAEKRLKALLDGKAMPDIDDQTRLCPKCGRPLPEDTNVCLGCASKGKTLLRLFGFTRPYRLRVALGVALTLGGALVDVIPPMITQRAVDNVFNNPAHPARLFTLYILALLLARVVSGLVQTARGRNVAWLSARITVAIRQTLFNKLQQLSLTFYDRRNVGSIMSRMTNDTTSLYDVLIDGIPIILQQGTMLILIPTFMLLMNWRVAIWTLVPVPIVMFGVYKFRRRMMRVWSRFHHSNARLSSALSGVLQGTKVVKAFHGEEREKTRFGRRLTDVAGYGYQAESSWATFFPMVLFLMWIGTFVIWIVGGRSILAGAMTLGQFMGILAYAAQMQQPMMMLQRIVDWTSRSLTAAERVFEVIDTPLDIEQSPHAVSMPHVEGGITFRDVHFSYDKTREVLHGIDLEIQPGEMIGVVGSSGAGKSTLINLLLRFYDPTQGAISLDGVDLRNIVLDDFRKQVGVVLQESYLFPGSIKDNIAYGRPDCSLQEVIEAAKAANAHQFIVNFPDGYDTYVGERGQRLSGGERQRIAIARAILHNPKVLILDEATSSVDTETERMIQEALERLVEGRTTIAIAHRLSTLREANRLIVMEDGKIVEIGTHDELLEKEDGVFKRLVDMQTQINKMSENYLPGGMHLESA
ncbi:MAG TPA: ABC transporter ATP-binding protein [Fimbriimonadaceae bacterium]|nr:ABC transporter ATP-binding protein [Fimbriimonadaceae bacterium]